MYQPGNPRRRKRITSACVKEVGVAPSTQSAPALSPGQMMKTLLAVLPVLSAGLYLMGSMYYQARLSGFGVEESLLPMPADRLLLSGFAAFLSFSGPVLMSSVIASAALVFAVIVTAVLSVTPQAQRWQAALERRWPRFRSKERVSPTMNGLVDKGANFFFYVSAAVMVVVLLVLIAALSNKAGKEQTEREIQDFAQGKGSIVTVTVGTLSSPTRAHLIECSAVHCAYWMDDGAHVFRHEQVTDIAATGKPKRVASIAAP